MNVIYIYTLCNIYFTNQVMVIKDDIEIWYEKYLLRNDYFGRGM